MNLLVHFVDEVVTLDLLRLISQDPLSVILNGNRLVYFLITDREDVVAHEIFAERHFEGGVEEAVEFVLYVVTEFVAESCRIFCLADLGVEELHEDFPIDCIVKEFSQIINSLVATVASNEELQLLRDSLVIAACGGISEIAEYSFDLLLHFLAI
jgi:hypothetical protein